MVLYVFAKEGPVLVMSQLPAHRVGIENDLALETLQLFLGGKVHSYNHPQLAMLTQQGTPSVYRVNLGKTPAN